jgi:hypothetical protein
VKIVVGLSTVGNNYTAWGLFKTDAECQRWIRKNAPPLAKEIGWEFDGEDVINDEFGDESIEFYILDVLVPSSGALGNI